MKINRFRHPDFSLFIINYSFFQVLVKKLQHTLLRLNAA